MLNVYTYAPRDHTASFYYRTLMPLKTMSDLGLPVRVMVDTDSASISEMDRVRAFCEADLCLMYQPVGQSPHQNIKQIQSFIPSKRDGQWKWPPSIVVESDDNLFHVSVLNPAYGNLGTRDPNGTEIPAGNTIGVMQHGEKVVKWIDGHVCDGTCGPDGRSNCGKAINLDRNRHNLDYYRRILESVDAFTCSTPEVAKAVQREVQPQRVRVFPNLIRFDDYEQVDLAPSNRIKILWQGGSNHYEDWYPLRKQIARIMKNYPMVDLTIWGALYPWVMEEIPAERYRYLKWSPYQEYKLRMSMIGHDINLAPLSNNPFNACRSAIKFYESSVLKKPAATLAQNTGAYAAEIQDGETGLLFNTPEEFESQLSYLIEQESERKRLAANAKDWVSEHRDAMKRVPEIFSFWMELREEKRKEQPHVTDLEWEAIERQVEAEEAEMAQMNGAP